MACDWGGFISIQEARYRWQCEAMTSFIDDLVSRPVVFHQKPKTQACRSRRGHGNPTTLMCRSHGRREVGKVADDGWLAAAATHVHVDFSAG